MKCSTKQLFCASGQNLCKTLGKEIMFRETTALNYSKV